MQRMLASTRAVLRLIGSGKANPGAGSLMAGATTKPPSVSLCETGRLCCSCSCAAAGAGTVVLTAGFACWPVLVGLSRFVLGLAPASAVADREAKLAPDTSPCFSADSERAAHSVMASICSSWACCCTTDCSSASLPVSPPAGLAPVDVPDVWHGLVLRKSAPESTMASIKSVVASNISDGSWATSTAYLSLASLRDLAAC